MAQLNDFVHPAVPAGLSGPSPHKDNHTMIEISGALWQDLMSQDRALHTHCFNAIPMRFAPNGGGNIIELHWKPETERSWRPDLKGTIVPTADGIGVLLLVGDGPDPEEILCNTGRELVAEMLTYTTTMKEPA